MDSALIALNSAYSSIVLAQLIVDATYNLISVMKINALQFGPIQNTVTKVNKSHLANTFFS